MIAPYAVIRLCLGATMFLFDRRGRALTLTKLRAVPESVTCHIL